MSHAETRREDWMRRRLASIAGKPRHPASCPRNRARAAAPRHARSADPALLELARVYGWPRGRVLRRIYVPSVRPHFLAALRSGLGFGWKAGIAAEVLTVPHSAIGRMIYESKLYLQTTDLFAWTLAVILLSVGLERLVLRALTPRGKGGGSA